MTERELQSVAESLQEASRIGKPVAPPTDTHPEMTIDEAYDVQLINVNQRIHAGRSVRGHKVGLTARSMQQLFGVFEPDYGHLLDDMFLAEGSAADIGRFIAPRVEIETGFILGRSLQGPGLTVVDGIRAIDFVVPTIEVIDSRIKDWRIRIADTIADNGSSAAVVVGAKATKLDALNLRDMNAAMEIDGETRETGNTREVLGNPITALVWLANVLGARGIELPEGMLVLPGTCVRAVPVERGDKVRGVFDSLGDVNVVFE